MSTRSKSVLASLLATAFVFGDLALTSYADDSKQPATAAQPTDTKTDEAKADDAKPAETDKDLVPIKLKLPKPVFKGTPKHVPPGTNLEKPTGKPRPPFMAPKGTENVALNKPVTSSDSAPIIGELKFVTDGEKEAKEGTYVELGPGLQWVQIDLGAKYQIYAIVTWRNHLNARVYHDIVVQVADDADFIENVRTLSNNDHDNSSGLGLGQEKEYWETFEGRLVDAKGTTARYVRLYSNGSTDDDMNHYTEVEVFGLPVK
ncbi:MAG: hypothetical protein JXO22_00585 [Phycisphaerae bacterium]|nr:hypothetical protein [Phycisphaerae bacterium]